MGTPSDFAGSNTLYRAPAGRDDVSDLHTFNNGTCIVSCWDLSPAELEEVTRTGRVFLSSFSGDKLFPVFVGSESVTRSVVADYGKIWPRSK